METDLVLELDRARSRVAMIERDLQRLRNANVISLRAELLAWQTAAAALDGRLGLPNDPDRVSAALEEYVAYEDALPGDRFDGDDFRLSKAVAVLARESAAYHEAQEALAELAGGTSDGS